jgi:hypothetical protein
LDAIASSARLLLSSLKRPSNFETDEDEGHDLLRASVLALFVSDCFGGCDRSASLGRTRRAIVSLRTEQPFICTCYVGSVCEISEASKGTNTPSGHFDFTGLCDRSIHIIKERRNSGIVPIGALQFGVCRHRAVLMKVILCSLFRLRFYSFKGNLHSVFVLFYVLDCTLCSICATVQIHLFLVSLLGDILTIHLMLGMLFPFEKGMVG